MPEAARPTPSASTAVSRLSHAKLPLSISHPCVTMMIIAATVAIGWGANSPNTTTS